MFRANSGPISNASIVQIKDLAPIHQVVHVLLKFLGEQKYKKCSQEQDAVVGVESNAITSASFRVRGLRCGARRSRRVAGGRWSAIGQFGSSSTADGRKKSLGLFQNLLVAGGRDTQADLLFFADSLHVIDVILRVDACENTGRRVPRIQRVRGAGHQAQSEYYKEKVDF